jgi:predicted nucleotidyltransferase
MNPSAELAQQLDRLVGELQRYGAERVILFGSAARGDADAYSDLDLVVVKPTPMNFVDRLADVVRKCPSAVCADVIVYTPEEFQRMQEVDNPFIEQVLSEGKVVYEKAKTAS